MQAWLYGEGLELPVKIEYDMTLAKQAYALAERWDASRSTSDVSQLDFKPTDLDDFNSNQKSKSDRPVYAAARSLILPFFPFLSRFPRTSAVLLRPPLLTYQPSWRGLQLRDFGKHGDSLPIL